MSRYLYAMCIAAGAFMAGSIVQLYLDLDALEAREEMTKKCVAVVSDATARLQESEKLFTRCMDGAVDTAVGLNNCETRLKVCTGVKQ